MYFRSALLFNALHFIQVRCQLPGLVSKVPQLSTFFNLLNSTSDLYSQVEKGGVTILAPNNHAFEEAGITNVDDIDKDQLEALLRYHILQDIQPLASFTGPPTFFTTLLNNATYTNLTGGAVVEGKEVDGQASVISALFKMSRVSGDIFWENGLMHEIDRVLDIPQPYAQTITAAHLDDLIALGQHLGLLQAGVPAVTGVQVWADVTVFAPNSPEYSTDYTGFDDLALSQELKLWLYHVVNGSVLYSNKLQNGTSFTTAAGLEVTAWQFEGDTYINNAKITQPDLFHASGVIQVLDRPLNPNSTDAHPAFPQEELGSEGKSGLGTGSKAGIAVGVILGVVIAAAGLYWFFARRRKQRGVELDSNENARSDYKTVPSGQWIEVEEHPEEMATKENTWELEARTEKQELSAVMGAKHELP